MRSYACGGSSRLLFGAALILSGLLWGGCVVNYFNADEGLVLPSGQAWVSDKDGFGVVFGADGIWKMIKSSDGAWVIYHTGTYSVEGDSIAVNGVGAGTYSVSGNTATITIDGDVKVFTKRSGINVAAPPPPSGGNLVLPQGQAWAYNSKPDGSHKEGYIFLADSTVYDLDYGYSIIGWNIERRGTYSANGSTVSITWGLGNADTWSYSVSGVKLTLGDGHTYTVVSTANVGTPVGGNLVLPEGQAWIYSDGDWGFVFKSNGSFQRIDYSGGIWVVNGSIKGLFWTSGGDITIRFETVSEAYPGTYSVAGNSLAMTIAGDVKVFTKTSVIIIATPVDGNP